MKLLNLTFVMVLFCLLTACSDEEVTCAQSDWVGTYAGTVACTGTDASDAQDVTFTVTASGTDAIVIKYETANVTAEYDPFTFTNCSISDSATDGVITQTVDFSLDGDTLTFTEGFSQGTEATTCVYTVTRS